MTNKIVVAKPGFNALTETDPNNLIFSSDYDSLKYYISGSTSLTPNGVDIETNITHGLGYIPFFIVYVHGINVTKYSMCPWTFSDAGNYANINAYADSTKLYFKIFTNTFIGIFTFTFQYKIFRNRLGI